MKKSARSLSYGGLVTPLILLLVLGVAAFTVPGFDKPQIYLNILKNAAHAGIMALGLLFVLICGDIDLSVGAQMSFYGVVLGLLLKTVGLSLPLAIGLTLVLAAALGCLQGVLVGRFRFHSMISTIACGVTLSGLTYILADGLPIFDLPGLPVSSASPLGLSWPALILVLVAVLAALVLHQTYWGRFFYALGCNAAAAERAGVPAARSKMLSFSLCSLCCGICAATYISQLGFAPLEAAGQEATTSVLTIAALGGASFSGGRGKVVPILCAALLLSALTSIFIVLRVPTYYQNCIKGLIIFIAISTKLARK